jgi:hypothetical protein
MKYGGRDSLTGGICPRCSESIDRHTIPFIESTEASLKLAEKLLTALDAVSTRGADLGLEAAGATMAGSLITTVGSEKKQYVTVSGGGVETLKKVKKSLGAGVILITDLNGCSNHPANTKATDIFGVNFIPTMTPAVQNSCGIGYPLGSCAAQKLLGTVFRYAKEKSKKVEKLEMTEILWKDVQADGHNRLWSTGTAVQSCDTCKRVVPQMLCTKVE